MKWEKPGKEMLNHLKIVAFYETEDEYGDKSLEQDIFWYEGISGTFCGTRGHPRLKMKELLGWYPIPELPRRENVG